MLAFALVALGAALAVGLELVEAIAIVLAVGSTRRWEDALLGAAAGAVTCGLLAAVLGPALAAADLSVLRLAIGALLLLFGLEWLRKGTLRRAGLKARSSSLAEFRETQEALADDPLPPPGTADWAGRAVAFKGVLLEGVEIVVIVGALAARPSGPAPALVGAGIAAALALGAAAVLRAPLGRLPETELKWGVGVMLTSFGTFFAGEGLGVHWPGGDAALLYVIAAVAGASQLQIRRLA